MALNLLTLGPSSGAIAWHLQPLRPPPPSERSPLAKAPGTYESPLPSLPQSRPGDVLRSSLPLLLPFPPSSEEPLLSPAGLRSLLCLGELSA